MEPAPAAALRPSSPCVMKGLSSPRARAMPAVLILSSLVAASRVGGSAQAAALERMGVRALLVPTVTLGRHPGLGAPGGGAVPDERFAGMLEGVDAASGFEGLAAMITGYFASAGQVADAMKAI